MICFWGYSKPGPTHHRWVSAIVVLVTWIIQRLLLVFFTCDWTGPPKHYSCFLPNTYGCWAKCLIIWHSCCCITWHVSIHCDMLMFWCSQSKEFYLGFISFQTSFRVWSRNTGLRVLWIRYYACSISQQRLTLVILRIPTSGLWILKYYPVCKERSF